MAGVILLVLIAAAVSGTATVVARLIFRDGNWDRALALIASLVVLGILSFTVLLPGDFNRDRDGPENGLLLLLGSIQAVGMWIVGAVAVLGLYPAVARRLP